MPVSRRSRRMSRLQVRKGGAGLNLVALMDIFTILVFFLLVNSSSVQPGSSTIQLPESTAEKLPEDTLVITVGGDSVLVQGRKVASVEQVMSSEQSFIPSLKEELEYQASRRPQIDPQQPREREVMIMGDRGIPYKLLKRIMVTCSQSEFSKVALAVIKKAPDHG